MRVACLYVPDLPLAAVLRVEPERRGEALAVTDGPGARALVVAVSDLAARLGVTPGMTATQARGVDARVALRPADPEAERATQAALCDVADSLSPRVEDAGRGVVYLDVDGLGGMFPTELALANALARRARAVGIEAHVGLGSTKVAAYLAARDGGGVTVIPPGEEWAFLAPLPVESLEPDPELARKLRRWGIRTVGQLLALPVDAVGTRLGSEGVSLVRKARGEDPHPLVARPAPLVLEESTELEYGIETLEPFLFVTRRLLDRLVARAQLRGFVCGELELELGLTSGGRERRTVPVAVPSNDVKALLALVRLRLENSPPSAPVEGIRLRATPELLRPAQLDLFRPSGPSPEKLSVTLARLVALCGADSVGTPGVADSHWPDLFTLGPFPSSAASARERASQVAEARGCFPLALRAFRPPRPLEVFYDRGRLDYVRGEGLSGRVVLVAGPWRVESDWWNDGARSRDYYEVQLSDGGVYRLYCERATRAWYADGVYD
ncbi:MAG: protein ImuB [Candidatus Binatia bacterium]|nr:MAG: protein ImuB [Candidatus Binatia bacterium]